MTDKDSEKEIKRIKKYINKWRKMMGLNWFTLNLEYDRSYAKDGAGARTYMDRWMYKEFDITFYLPVTSDLDDDKLESVIVHEFVHCLTAPFACAMVKGIDDNDNNSRDLMEQTTSIVSDAFEWVYQGGRDNGTIKSPNKEKK